MGTSKRDSIACGVQKVFGALFVLMALIAAPIMVFAFFGQQLTSEDKDGLYLAQLSIANVGYGALSPESIATMTGNASTPVLQLPFPIPFVTGQTWPIADIVMLITYCVLANALMFIGFVLWFPNYVEGQRRLADESQVTAADFTILVKGLPKDATEKEIIDHFSKLYNLWEDDWTYESCCVSKRKRRAKFLPDNEINRSRWANSQGAQQSKHGGSFFRTTANPVMNVDHVVDTLLDAEDADPDGSRHEQIQSVARQAARGASLSLADDDNDDDGSESEGAAADARERGMEGAAALREMEAGVTGIAEAPTCLQDSFSNEGQLVQSVIESHADGARMAALFPGELGERAKNVFATWVADVAIVNPNGPILAKYLQVQTMLRSLQKETSRARMLRDKRGMEAPAFLKQLERLDKLEERLRQINATALDKWDSTSCVAAFVTFENEESRRRCEHDFEEYPGGCCRHQPTPLRFRGKHVLSISRASEPEEIAWENMDLSDRERCWRQSFTAVVVALILLVSLAVIVAANAAKTSFTESLPNPAVCSRELPALHYGGYKSVPVGAKLVKNSTLPCSQLGLERSSNVTAVPGDGMYGSSRALVGLQFSPLPTAQGFTNANTTVADRIAQAGDARCVEGNCWGLQDSFRCKTIGSATVPSFSFVGSSVVGCYCIQQIVDALNQHGADALRVVQEQDGELCTAMLTNYAAGQSMVVGAALLVVVVNAVLNTVLRSITKFERHANRSDATASLSFKIFLAQFINTALIVVLVNAQLDFIKVIGLENGLFGLFAGGFRSFVPKWYSAVGVGICITMLTNVVVPHTSTIIGTVLRPLKLCFMSPVDNEEASAVYKLPAFDPSSKYPIILNVVFVTLMYSAGMPILFVVAALFMWVTYWVDRYCLMRCTSRPAYEDAEVARQIGRLLPASVLLYLAIGMWMLGDSTTLASPVFSLGMYASANTADAQKVIDQYIAELSRYDPIDLVPRIVRANTFPVFILLLLVIVLRIAYALLGAALLAIIRRIVCIGTCGLCCRRRDDGPADDLLPSFTGQYFQALKESNVEQFQAKEDDSSKVVADRYRGGMHMMVTWQFTTEEEEEDWRHAAGLPKRTWQVIEEQNSSSYHIDRIPVYSDAYYAIQEGMDFQQAAMAEENAEEEEEEVDEAALAEFRQQESMSSLSYMIQQAAKVSPAGEAEVIGFSDAAEAPAVVVVAEPTNKSRHGGALVGEGKGMEEYAGQGMQEYAVQAIQEDAGGEGEVASMAIFAGEGVPVMSSGDFGTMAPQEQVVGFEG
jgi:hypothetical protein